MKSVLALAAFLLIGADAPKQTTFGDIIGICRVGFVETLMGRRPDRAMALLAGLSDDVRPAAAAMCLAYTQGQADLMAVQSAALKQGAGKTI